MSSGLTRICLENAICRVVYRANVSYFGVADFGYDLYFLAVAKLLNNKYLKLFSFDFHTLIQQRPYFKVLTG